MTTYFLFFSSPFGKLCLTEKNQSLCQLLFPHELPPADGNEQPTILLQTAVQQLQEYFAGRLRSFDLPLHTDGTPFRQQVWQALLTIPYGQTRTYGQIARQIGCPHAARAVGGANHHNPLPIFIPCHRVIGADHSLVGYGGGLSIKKALLSLEGCTWKE